MYELWWIHDNHAFTRFDDADPTKIREKAARLFKEDPYGSLVLEILAPARLFVHGQDQDASCLMSVEPRKKKFMDDVDSLLKIIDTMKHFS
jgi:hypothetical protein